MSVVTDYKIIVAPEYFHVTEAVQLMLADGWQPLGGVSVSIDYHPDVHKEYRMGVRFAQAVVKYDNGAASDD